MRTYSDFWIITLDEQGHKKTCNYWYLVESPAGTAHTAFNQRRSLALWARERGLTLPELGAHGEHSSTRMGGSYREQAHSSYDEFYALAGERTKTLSNGDVTLAIITHDADGLRTVHTLNPNCRDRPTFDHAIYRAERG